VYILGRERKREKRERERERKAKHVETTSDSPEASGGRQNAYSSCAHGPGGENHLLVSFPFSFFFFSL
jgi:hypothetical protein